MVLDRIALMANFNRLPDDLRKLASWVGGIRPGEDGTDPQPYSQDWPDWADAGNEAYKAMVDELLGTARNSDKDLTTAVLLHGYDNLESMGAECTGECVEAALAGAFAASRFFPE